MSRDPGASRGAPDIAGNALRPAPGRVGTFASEQSIEPGRPHARGRRPAATCSNAAPWTVLAGGWPFPGAWDFYARPLPLGSAQGTRVDVIFLIRRCPVAAK